MSERLKRVLVAKLGMLFLLLYSSPVMATAEGAVASGAQGHAWWFWPLVLLIVTFVMGVLAVLGGVGGGVLFVPIISGFFPFHLDFVRGTGLLVALSGALAAGPGLLKMNLASLRLAIPVALIASSCAIVGAMIGLALPTNIPLTPRGTIMPNGISQVKSWKNSPFVRFVSTATVTPITSSA